MTKMKSKQLFWGFFFLTLGFLYLILKFGVEFDFDFISWDLWPLLLILAGIAIIAEGTFFRPILSGVFGIIVALIVYGFLGNIFFEEDDTVNSFQTHNYRKTFTVAYDSSITVANLSLKAGAGKFFIKDDADELMYAKAYGDLPKYTMSDSRKDSIIWIDIKTEKHKFKFFENKPTKFNLKLNANPVWNLDFELGAAKSEIDLSKLKVKNFVLKTGATKTEIKLGDKLPKTYLNIDMGVASLKIKIPESSGCKIIGEMGLVSKDLEGFEKFSDGLYKTANYDTAKNKIIIDFNGGVAKFEVERY